MTESVSGWLIALAESAGDADGREAPVSAETRFDANLALKAIAFSASAMGSRGGSVAAGVGDCVAGDAGPPTCVGAWVPAAMPAVDVFCCWACCWLCRCSAVRFCSNSAILRALASLENGVTLGRATGVVLAWFFENMTASRMSRASPATT